MSSTESEKPQCGSQPGDSTEEYDLPLHVAALFMVLIASCIGAGFPVACRKYAKSKALQSALFACKHFGTGVLVATAFVHLLPTAFGSLNNPCLPDLFTDDYPALPGVIMMGSMFILFVIEMYLNEKTGGHSHGLPDHKTGAQRMGPPPRPAPPPNGLERTQTMDSMFDDEIAFQKMNNKMYEQAQSNWEKGERESSQLTSTMPAWFIVFYEQYLHQRSEMIEMIRSYQLPSSITPKSDFTVENSEYFDQEGQAVDPAVFKKMSTNITLLEGGILFHSVFVGMTVSITTDGFIILLVAILFHQMFEGLGLGARIAAVPYPKNSPRPWLLVFAFGTTAPIGQAIGLLTRGSYDPESAFGLIIVGVFNAISSGLLIYAALVDLLAEDFLSEDGIQDKKDKVRAFCWVLLGAAGMSIVGAFA